MGTIAVSVKTDISIGNQVKSGQKTVKSAYVVSKAPAQLTDGGAGAAKASVEWSSSRSLSSTNETLDLSGALVNGAGETAIFAKVRLLYVENTSAAGTITLDTTASNGATALFDGTIVLNPGEAVCFLFLSTAGHAITAATADLLKVTASAACTYEFAIAGE
jgi:hypothetical protein